MMFNKSISLFFILIISSCFTLQSDENLESTYLKNIRQITFSEMGFEKAGEGYFSKDGKKIAFQAVPKGEKNYQIYLMDLDDLVPKMVSTGKGACTCAYFHPTLNKMIFASSHEDPSIEDENFHLAVPGYKREGGNYSWDFTPYMNIYELDLETSELKALTTGVYYHAECAYSSDGSKIVYASNEDGSMNIYTMNADGSSKYQVTHTTNCYNGGPFFSPDDQQIIFRADRERPHYLQIFIVDMYGDHEIQLGHQQAVNWAPYWHPDGKHFCYTTSLHGHHQYEIYLMNVETLENFRITYNPTFDGLGVFSSDGSQFMWTSKRSIDQTSQLFLAEFNLP